MRLRLSIPTSVLLVFVLDASVRADAADSVADRVKQGYYELRGIKRFVYIDAHGREVMVERIDSVPERFRNSLRPLEPEPEAAQEETDESLFSFDVLKLGSAPDGQTIYRFVNPDGRVVYTNVVERVPPELRKQSAVDLTKVSLHSELGNAIERQLMQEHQRLKGSGYCTELTREANTSYLRRVWDDYAPLVVGAGVLFVLFAFTPFALRRVDAPAWAKTLTFIVPVVVVGGVFLFIMSHTTRAVGALNELARPCQMATWSHLGDRNEPYSLGKHAERLQGFAQQVEAASKMGIDKIERGLGE